MVDMYTFARSAVVFFLVGLIPLFNGVVVDGVSRVDADVGIDGIVFR